MTHSLPRYLDMARKAIEKYSPEEHRHRLLNDDDAVGSVATSLMEAEWRKQARPAYEARRQVLALAHDTQPDIDDVAVEDLSWDDLVESAEPIDLARQRVEEVLELLTPLQRKYVHMYFIAEYPMAEIAHAFGVTYATVEATINRSLRKLRKLARP